MAESILLGEPTDPLLLAVKTVIQQRGLGASIMSIEEFVGLVTIRVSDDGFHVSPEVPLLLRSFSSGSAPEFHDSDMSFMIGERLAVLWAAAFLSRAQVINRPSTNAIPGRACFEVAVDFSRSTLVSNASCPVRTSYSSTPAQLPSRVLAVKELATGNTWQGDPPEAATASAVAARDTLGSRWYERVIVVGKATWCHAPRLTGSLDVPKESIRLCSDLGLDFATVTWEVEPLLSQFLLARVDPYPSASHLGSHLMSVAKALAGILIK